MHGNNQENCNLVKTGCREIKLLCVEKWIDIHYRSLSVLCLSILSCGQIKYKNYFLKLHAMQLYLRCKHPSWDSINSSTRVMSGSSISSL